MGAALQTSPPSLWCLVSECVIWYVLQGGTGDGTTPSLLDARAASPSAVYATRFMATPFRGALAALPMDAALAAPLVDSSPFQLSDSGLDTVCLADEAQRVAANLAMAAGGFAATPGVLLVADASLAESMLTPIYKLLMKQFDAGNCCCLLLHCAAHRPSAMPVH